jgi:hypothetical protein
VAFELDGDAHLLAGISAAHIRPTGLDPTRRLSGSDSVDHESCCHRESESLRPQCQLALAQHGRISSPSPRPSRADYRGPAVRTSRPDALASDPLLRARLPRPLKSPDVTHAGFIDQLLHVATVPDSSTNLGHEFFRDVNGEPSAFAPAVQSIAAMTFSGCASGAVLSDARTLPQRQRTSGYWPVLLDGIREPAPEMMGIATHRTCDLIHICKTKVKKFIFPNRLSPGDGSSQDATQSRSPQPKQASASVGISRQRYASHANAAEGPCVAYEGHTEGSAANLCFTIGKVILQGTQHEEDRIETKVSEVRA